MLLLGAAICLGLAGLVVGLQLHWIRRFARLYPVHSRPTPASEALPRVGVLLPVRGADPSLRDCLLGLLTQDYPHYDIYIVVDSLDDPAWEIVRKVLQEHPSAQVHVDLLRSHRDTCSLKVSALLQAIGELDPGCQAVAMIDADVIPPAGWLRALVEPLSDPAVGATSGVRWFDPGDNQWGTLVRAHWNAAACTQMHALEIPWGGSMALRADVFRSPTFLNSWAVSLCDDTGVSPVLRQLGLRLQIVPAVTMMNHETIALRPCFSFVRRQVLSARLYHPAWPIILAIGLLSGGTLLAGGVLLLLALIWGAWGAALCAGLTVAVHLGLGCGLVRLDGRIRQLVQNQTTPPAVSAKALLALLHTHVVYFAALVTAALLRRVDWRGVTYEVAGPWKVRLVEYRPYRAPTREVGKQVSVG